MDEGGRTMELMKKSKKDIDKAEKPYAEWYSEEEAVLHVDTVPYISFPALDQYDWLKMAFSTRRGGVSIGPLSSMNLGWDKALDYDNVCQNYKIICERLDLDYEKLVIVDQVHGTRVAYVDEKKCAGGEMRKKIWRTDGVITDVPGVILTMTFADCVPIFLIDTQQRRIAIVHAGWRGTIDKIVHNALDMMFEQGSQAKDIVAVIGPSVCQSCYDIGSEVEKQFREHYTEEQCSKLLKRGFGLSKDHQQLDLWAANWYQLREKDILPENIHVSGVCTCCNHSLLYSHRYTRGKRGSLCAFLSIRS